MGRSAEFGAGGLDPYRPHPKRKHPSTGAEYEGPINEHGDPPGPDHPLHHEYKSWEHAKFNAPAVISHQWDQLKAQGFKPYKGGGAPYGGPPSETWSQKEPKRYTQQELDTKRRGQPVPWMEGPQTTRTGYAGNTGAEIDQEAKKGLAGKMRPVETAGWSRQTALGHDEVTFTPKYHPDEIKARSSRGSNSTWVEAPHPFAGEGSKHEKATLTLGTVVKHDDGYRVHHPNGTRINPKPHEAVAGPFKKKGEAVSWVKENHHTLPRNTSEFS